MTLSDKIRSLLSTSNVNVRPQYDERIMSDAFAALEKSERTKSAAIEPNVWRIIMKSRISKLAAAAIIAVAGLSIIFFGKSIPTASAAQVLAEAAEAVSDIFSVHIKARMRTLPQDNFASIGLGYDFVPVEMWKQVDEAGLVRWRIEKPERVAVMDGEEATLLVRESYADRGRCPDFMCYDCHWCGQLMNVNGLLQSELEKAQQRKDVEFCVRLETIDGAELLVLEVEVPAQGDFTNDYIKNKFISKSDHTRVYYFDAESMLLEGFEIYVHVEGNDVLVFETTDIEYNLDFDDSLFTLSLPDDVIWWQTPEILPDNERYEQLTPRQAAEAFFEACANEDWEEFLKFWPASGVGQQIKDYLGGLEVISLGEPFQSGGLRSWFIPYEIKLKSGRVKKHNLAVRKDNPARRYVVDGGI
jgi:outer membrane lipoprotein-sorting protein